MATAVDLNITVTRGFFVSKGPAWPSRADGGSSSGVDAATAEEQSHTPPAPPPLHAVGSVRRGEDGGGGMVGARGLLSGLSSVSAAAIAPLPLGGAAGSPAVGSLTVGEHAHLSAGCKRLVKSVVRGLKACQEPEAASEGLGGTYFFMSELGQKVAIMKPCDEEPMAPNNPKGFVGRQLGEPGLKPTVRVGEAASREVAAYLLDHGHFARVPHTVMVKMEHPVFHVAAPPPPSATAASAGEAQPPGDDSASSPAPLEAALSSSSAFSAAGASSSSLVPRTPCKLGSLQEFVPHDCDTSEMGASRFAVRDVHRIGILDLRLLNTDRHAGNMLVRRTRPGGSDRAAQAGAHLLDGSAYELVPIDHGFALPEALEPPYFEWQHWPQAMMPFGREELDYITSLDAQADVEMLRREVPSLREESLRLLHVSTTLLKACAAAGLSLAEIAAVVTRPLIGMDEEPSELERICFAARAEVEEEDEEEGELTDLEEEEGEEEEAGDGGSEVPGFAGHLSAEEEGQSPTFSSSSAGGSSSSGGAAVPRLRGRLLSLPTASDASRLLDEALFSMDEDGPKSPALAHFPGLPALALAARAASGSGSATSACGPAPNTPAAVVGASAAAFPSPSSPDHGSLSASLESMSLGGSGSGALPAGVAAAEAVDPASPPLRGRAGDPAGPKPMSLASSGVSAFAGAASFVPGFSDGRPLQRPRLRRRRPVMGNRLRKRLPAEIYPPLVESRCPPSSRIFSDLDPEQWALFMAIFSSQVQAKLRAGAWKACAAASAVGMSCPKF